MRLLLSGSVLCLAGFAAALQVDRPGAIPSRSLPPAAADAARSQQPTALPLPSALSVARTPALFARLDQADREWIPRAIPLPGGRTRYVYKRRAGDPPLDVEQIKWLMRNPPSFATERRTIQLLLEQLQRVGAAVVLETPRKPGAAGEWEPRKARLRIRPDVPAKGTREFARVLNHEAIHVAQSCRAGSPLSQPIPLGLSRDVTPQARQHLAAPLYAQASTRERTVEEEAYANQDNLSIAWQMLQVHCRRR